MDPNLAWGALLAGGLYWEMRAVFNKKVGDTLSERLRVWFFTHTKTGKAAFTIAWLAFTAWFIPHIISGGS